MQRDAYGILLKKRSKMYIPTAVLQVNGEVFYERLFDETFEGYSARRIVLMTHMRGSGTHLSTRLSQNVAAEALDATRRRARINGMDVGALLALEKGKGGRGLKDLGAGGKSVSSSPSPPSASSSTTSTTTPTPQTALEAGYVFTNLNGGILTASNTNTISSKYSTATGMTAAGSLTVGGSAADSAASAAALAAAAAAVSDKLPKLVQSGRPLRDITDTAPWVRERRETMLALMKQYNVDPNNGANMSSSSGGAAAEEEDGGSGEEAEATDAADPDGLTVLRSDANGISTMGDSGKVRRLKTVAAPTSTAATTRQKPATNNIPSAATTPKPDYEGFAAACKEHLKGADVPLLESDIVINDFTTMLKVHKPYYMYKLMPLMCTDMGALDCLQAICALPGSPFRIEHRREPIPIRTGWMNARSPVRDEVWRYFEPKMTPAELAIPRETRKFPCGSQIDFDGVMVTPSTTGGITPRMVGVGGGGLQRKTGGYTALLQVRNPLTLPALEEYGHQIDLFTSAHYRTNIAAEVPLNHEIWNSRKTFFFVASPQPIDRAVRDRMLKICAEKGIIPMEQTKQGYVVVQ